MVRRASRLPPNAKSLEEVVLDRIANGGSAVQPQSGSAVNNTRRISGKANTPHSTSISSSYGVTPPPATPSATLERIQSLAVVVTQMNERLQSVATTKRRSSIKTSTEGNERRHHRDQIEEYIRESTSDVYASYAARKAEEATTTKSSSSGRASYDPARGAQVNHAVRELRSTVRRLDKVFYEVATGDKQRHIAATKITTLVRGFIIRRRYRKMNYALGQWRARKCIGVLTYLEQFSAREEFLHKQIQRLHVERTHTLMRRVIAEIRDVALMNLPMRRKRLDEADRRFKEKQDRLVIMVFAAWKQSALGPRSRKKATADARARHMAARQRLQDLDRFDVITTEMVHEEFLKENIRVVRGRHPYCVLKTYFTLLLNQEYLPMKRKTAMAIAHERKKLLTLVWLAWLPLFRAAQVDKAMAKVNERRTLDRFEKQHNLRKIDAHYRHTHSRKHLRAWAMYGQRIRRVRKLFEDNTKSKMAQLLQRWHVRAKYQRALRANAVEEWKAHCRRIFQTPFRVWYTYAATRRADRQAKESICVAYQRRQRRHTKYTFFRLWKHHVLFGNVEGIHSKIHLLRNLEDQKRQCLALEANAKLYQQNIVALQQSINQIEARLTDKQLELIQVQDATQATRFSIHSAEQSIARVQGMLEAVRQIHPGTLERIEKMFKENPLLTQDLKEVVALHVKKRREVMEKIALDETEMEIQKATQQKDGQVREDQLLLHRVKWVFSRLDLQSHQLHQKNPNYQTPTVAIESMHQLCALFEFIRNGETQALTKDNDPSIPRGLGGLQVDGTNTGVCVGRDDLVEGSDTWHSFLKALTVKFAPEQTLQLKERLVKRAEEMGDELSELKANPHIYNAYSGSGHLPE